jgi:hypothetical protein
VRCYRYAPTVRMLVALMRSLLSDERKTITLKGGDNRSGSERPKDTVVDVHALDGDRDARGLLRNLFDLDRIFRAFR